MTPPPDSVAVCPTDAAAGDQSSSSVRAFRLRAPHVSWCTTRQAIIERHRHVDFPSGPLAEMLIQWRECSEKHIRPASLPDTTGARVRSSQHRVRPEPLFQRHGSSVTLMDMARLAEFSVDSPRLSRPEAIAEGNGWSVLLPGTPIAADGADLGEAAEEFVTALREFAEDWAERLKFAPNHTEHWPLVRLVSLNSDADLTAWIHSGA